MLGSQVAGPLASMINPIPKLTVWSELLVRVRVDSDLPRQAHIVALSDVPDRERGQLGDCLVLVSDVPDACHHTGSGKGWIVHPVDGLAFCPDAPGHRARQLWCFSGTGPCL